MDASSLMLILMAGMPGAGKSTVALALSAGSGIPVIDKDVVVSSLLDEDIADEVAHPAAYRAIFDLAEHLLRVQRLSVIVDTPAGNAAIVNWATTLCTETGAVLVPVLCSADGMARHDRMTVREGLRSHSKGTSRRPGTARERFAHLPDDTIELDTMAPLEDVLREAISQVRSRLANTTDHLTVE